MPVVDTDKLEGIIQTIRAGHTLEYALEEQRVSLETWERWCTYKTVQGRIKGVVKPTKPRHPIPKLKDFERLHKPGAILNGPPMSPVVVFGEIPDSEPLYRVIKEFNELAMKGDGALERHERDFNHPKGQAFYKQFIKWTEEYWILREKFRDRHKNHPWLSDMDAFMANYFTGQPHGVKRHDIMFKSKDSDFEYDKESKLSEEEQREAEDWYDTLFTTIPQ